MRIVNGAGVEAWYELKGGPLRMTMSTCALLPGEEEVWTSPYRRQEVEVTCELHVDVGEQHLVVDTGADATVFIESAAGGFRLRVVP